MSSAHPKKERLIAFGLGRLAAEESTSVEQHLEVCRECCATLLDMQDDTFIGLVRLAKPVPETKPRVEATPGDTEEAFTDAAVPEVRAIPGSAENPASAGELCDPDEAKRFDAGLPPELARHPRYRIVELIGRGGMGNVYRAEHRLMNRPVAIKVINSQLVQNAQAVERFRREVQAAAKLSHPNIVAAYDAEQAGNAHFLVMEFVHGTDLASIVRQRGPMSVAEACECIRQAATGLQHAHEKGMVHRDIKPHNLMMSRESGTTSREPRSGDDSSDARKPHPDGPPLVRILDFGLAGFASEAAAEATGTASADNTAETLIIDTAHLTRIGSMMGTPDYIAPEQAEDAHSADIRADIYSLGCTLVFLLTGKPPFEAESLQMKLKAHAEQSPPSLTNLRNDVSDELSGIVSRMMAKDPSARFQTPAEVVAALTRLSCTAETPPRKRTLRNVLTAVAAILLAGAIFVMTDKGRIEIHADTDDVEVVVSQGGRQIRTVDLATGSQVLWMPSGDYSIALRDDRQDVRIDNDGFVLSRWGKQIVRVVRQPQPANDAAPEIRSGEPVVDRRSLNNALLQVLAAAEAYLQVVDNQEFDRLQPMMSELARAQTTREGIAHYHQQALDAFGACSHRELIRIARIRPVPGLPPGQYGTVLFRSSFTGGSTRFETLMLNTDPDQRWRVNAYAVSLERPQLPAELPADEPSAADRTSSGTTTEPGMHVNEPQPDARRSVAQGDTLTSEPNATAADNTEAAKPVVNNLINDPSFENTPLTQLPDGWRRWLNDGQEFRCEVVTGGHTGERCLQITGTGTRGVVFGNDLRADRSKRYALKGWVKFEGDEGARALIKFNYFRGSEFLGVHDLVGATADQPGWHLFEKTDALDAFPTADHFYVMCHVEGSGTGWFDDLELMAYDRDNLPGDFDVRHGRHNRLHGPHSLHRWVGTWETEYVFREFDNSPTETRLSMTTTSEQTLGDYFLLSHAKAVPVASGDRKPPLADPPANAAALGGEERLLLLTFDQNLGAFRQWVFSSNGKVFEWRGPWNNQTQTLELRMLPDASNLHSTEHFVSDDQIEAKLWFQYVMGQRDAGRWTATRRAFDGKVDVPIAKTHVAEPAELSQLNKFAGEWTIRAQYKPSVWNPEPREETIRETSVWILGGRFLMTRAFNEKDELTSIWIASWDPREKSNRFWFFNADGSSGEWRLTWDEPSSGFQFRAVDLPSGWSGTGFNRWVDEDSFDNQALIKDETGRVLLDSTQERRRKK